MLRAIVATPDRLSVLEKTAWQRDATTPAGAARRSVGLDALTIGRRLVHWEPVVVLNTDAHLFQVTAPQPNCCGAKSVRFGVSTPSADC